MSEGVQPDVATTQSNSSVFPVTFDHSEVNENASTLTLPSFPVLPPYFMLLYYLTVAIRITAIPVSFLGLVSNPINMAVFSKQMNSDTVSVSLFGMAISDFFVCLSTFLGATADFPVIEKFFLLQLSIEPRDFWYMATAFPNLHFGRITLTISTFITLERCLCVAMPLKVKMIFTSKRCKIIMFISFLVNLLQMLPYYFTYSFTPRFYPPLNRSIYRYMSKPGYEDVIKYRGPFVLSFFYVQFSLIIICTAILIVVLNRKRAWRKSVTTASVGQSSNQVSSKELKVIKMMVMVSSLFIACNLPTTVLYMAVEADSRINFEGTSKHLYDAIGYVSAMLLTINSSVNIFIYYFNSSSYHERFNQMFGIKGKEIGSKSSDANKN